MTRGTSPIRTTLFAVAVLVSLLPAAAPAADWNEFKTGPFQVLTDAPDRQAQDRLAELEQLRHVVGAVLGKQDAMMSWPARVVVFRNAKQYDSYAASSPLGLSRAGLSGAILASSPVPQAWMRECARLLINDNATGRMPAAIESGLATFYSTIEVSGSRVTAGAPPPEAQRSRDWARIHMLSVDPAYYGKMRILLFNLQQGVDAGPAFRNAFGKDPAQIEKELDAHIAANYPGGVSLSGKPLNPRTDFRRVEATPLAVELALADLLFADPARSAQARSAYDAILKKRPDTVEAQEGLGLLAARDKRDAEAKQLLAAAAKGGSANGRAWLEYGRLERKRDALEKAASLAPRYTEIYREMAAQSEDSSHRLQAWKAAAKADPRTAANWRALAETYIEREEYPDAAKAWAAAERAAADDVERAKIRESRKWVEDKRLDYERSARQRAIDEKQAELQRAKDNAMAEIRAAEARANLRASQRTPQEKEKDKIVQGGETPSGKVAGKLTLVSCQGKTVRISVRGDGGKTTRLLIRDPGKVIIKGGGTVDFVCGPQRKPRSVAIEYFEKPDARLGTAGDVATIEYQ